MPVTQVIGLVHMTQRDPLETRRQESSDCSAIILSLSVLRARYESGRARFGSSKLELAPMFVVAGSSEPLRNHSDNGAAIKSDALWRFVRAHPVLEHIRACDYAPETNGVVAVGVSGRPSRAQRCAVRAGKGSRWGRGQGAYSRLTIDPGAGRISCRGIRRSRRPGATGADVPKTGNQTDGTGVVGVVNFSAIEHTRSRGSGRGDARRPVQKPLFALPPPLSATTPCRGRQHRPSASPDRRSGRRSRRCAAACWEGSSMVVPTINQYLSLGKLQVSSEVLSVRLHVNSRWW
jgi:hypothetical protein